jgi:NAD(P)H-flavin reductase
VPVVTAPLLGVTPVTTRARLLQIDLHAVPFEFLPGQAVLVANQGQPVRRPYSIACSPERATETRRLELLVGLEPGSEVGAHLSLVPGTLLDIEGPVGTFTLSNGDRHPWLLFAAGGTGIAPLRSMIDHVLRRDPARHVSILYSARRADDFAFIEELRDHERAKRLELHQTVTRDDSTSWAGGRGRIGRSHFEAVLHAPAETLCFVCGPREMVAESVVTLETLGVPAHAIRTEGWKGA